LTLKGTVTDWIWANPHCFLKFDAMDETGTVRNWAVEVSNPTDMTKRGWGPFVVQGRRRHHRQPAAGEERRAHRPPSQRRASRWEYVDRYGAGTGRGAAAAVTVIR
jgi:hypothetical protein